MPIILSGLYLRPYAKMSAPELLSAVLLRPPLHEVFCGTLPTFADTSAVKYFNPFFQCRSRLAKERRRKLRPVFLHSDICAAERHFLPSLFDRKL